MKLRLLYIIIVITGLGALAGKSDGPETEAPGRLIELTCVSSQCQRSIVSLKAHNDSPFSKAQNEERGAGSVTISSSDAVPHASVTTISPQTFAVLISLLNNDKHDRALIITAPARLTVLHKVLFRAIISPNAP